MSLELVVLDIGEKKKDKWIVSRSVSEVKVFPKPCPTNDNPILASYWEWNFLPPLPLLVNSYCCMFLMNKWCRMISVLRREIG